MKTLRSIVIRSLCAAVLILLCTACNKGNAHCCLCGAPASAYPYILELFNGNIAELRPADYGTAAFSNVGGISLHSMDTESVTATLPVTSETINRSLYCASCLAILDNTPNSGYVLADLHDPSHVTVFGINDGTVISLPGCSITIQSDDDNNTMVLFLEAFKP